MKIIHEIRRRLDYATGRYEPFFAESRADREASMAVLDEVRRRELSRVVGKSALESLAFVDAAVDDLILACRDTRSGRIVGCVRATSADQVASIPATRSEYRLDLFPPELLPRVGIATRLAFLCEHRKGVGSFVLLEKMYSEGVARGFLFCLLSCEPGLYPLYAKLGFRPLGRVHASEGGGFRVPMIMVNHDAEHLAAVGSPLLRALQRARGPLPDDGVRWFRGLSESERDPRMAYFRDVSSPVHRALSEGLSPRGKAELLAHAMTVTCEGGQTIIREGDGGRSMGVVMSGAVEVRRRAGPVEALGEGDLFGESSAILSHRQPASVVAASKEVRLLLLSQSASERLTRPRDRETLWRNLARHMARRLDRRGLEGAA
jgi:hypothetical protein